MRKKGFTLVELLAVIIILGIISLIAIFVVRGVRRDYDRKGFETSSKSVLRAALDYFAKNDYKGFPEIGIDVRAGILDLQMTDEYISGLVCLNDDGNFELINLSNGTWCANGTIDNIEVETYDSIDCPHLLRCGDTE